MYHDVTTVHLGISLTISLSRLQNARSSIIVLCALLFSNSVDAFGSCADDSDCPDNAECDNNDDVDQDCDGESCQPIECECKEGLDEIDLPKITIDGRAATVCVGMKQ